MIALEMMGPMNEVVVPTMLKKEKNRNSFPRGVTSEICCAIMQGGGGCQFLSGFCGGGDWDDGCTVLA